MKIKITDSTDIKKLADAIPNKESSILVRKSGIYLCVIKWSDVKNNWMVYFNDFMSYKCGNPTLLKILSSDEPYDVFLLSSKEELRYEIIDDINRDIIDCCMSGEGNLPHIIRNTKPDLGKPVSFGHSTCILVGVSSTLEDYYYYGMTPERKLKFFSCVGGYDVIDNPSEELQNLLDDPNLDERILQLRVDCFMDKYEVEVIHI